MYISQAMLRMSEHEQRIGFEMCASDISLVRSPRRNPSSHSGYVCELNSNRLYIASSVARLITIICTIFIDVLVIVIGCIFILCTMVVPIELRDTLNQLAHCIVEIISALKF